MLSHSKTSSTISSNSSPKSTSRRASLSFLTRPLSRIFQRPPSPASSAFNEKFASEPVPTRSNSKHTKSRSSKMNQERIPVAVAVPVVQTAKLTLNQTVFAEPGATHAEICAHETHVPPVSTYTAFASAADGKTFVEKQLELPKLGRNDVAVAILCCSVCFTDTMYAAMIEGQVVGHEIIGRVEFKGEDVTNVEIGDTIGFGYLRTACLACLFCLQGQENMCPKRTTFTDGIGGFANASVWDSRFVYKIPACIEPRHAGPLTCAGATVFSALYGYNVSPTSTVGVVGLGGLGHLAIKFAKAWGCRVVAISSSESKKEDSLKFGAHEFICTKDPITSTTKMDYILNTTSGDLPWDIFIDLLETNGTLINMGVSAKGSMEIPAMTTLFKQLKVVGSLVASRHVMNKMFDFAALHNIRPEIEELDMGTKGCKEAVRRVVEQQARYRVVLNVPQHLAM